MHFIVVKLKTLIMFVAVILAIIMLGVSINGQNYAQVYFGGNLRKIPIYNVKTEEKVVAISFDAAWGADKTEKIMEILTKEWNSYIESMKNALAENKDWQEELERKS